MRCTAAHPESTEAAADSLSSHCPLPSQVLGATALHPTYPTALHPTAVYPSALHPTALHPTVLYPSALLEDQVFLDYNLATAFLGLESYWIAPVLNGGLL